MFSRYRMVNPLLGVYYGIFTAAFIGLGVLLLILEYMGVIEQNFVYVLTVAALFLTVVVALASTSMISDEFFVSGRRVPSGLNGLVIFVMALGGAGLSGVVGLIFFWGMEGIGLLLGLLAGVIVAGVLVASFVRKSGVYSIPSFLELRFHSRFIGLLSGVLLLLPSVCFALAELSLIKILAPYLFGFSVEYCLIAVLGVLLLMLLPGGVRSMSWAQCCLAIVVLIGVLVPLILISLQYTNLPFGQFTYGSLIDDVARFEEVSQKLGEEPLSKQLPLVTGVGQSVKITFLGGVGGFGLLETIAMFFFVTGGVAGMPAILLRASVCSNVFQARKSFAWGAAFVGLLIFTIPAYGIFLRYLLFDPQMQILLSSLPSWLERLQSMGLFHLNDVDGDGQLLAQEIKIARDGVFIGLPMVAGFKQTLQSLTFAALMCAAMAGLAGRVMAMAHTLVRDFAFNFKREEVDGQIVNGMGAVRIGLILVVILLGWSVMQFSFDPFQMFLAGLLYCALSLFPVMILSIWWNRMTKVGVVFGMILGCSLACWILFSSQFGAQTVIFDLSMFVVGALSMGLVFVVSILLTLIGPRPSLHELETLVELRTPGGEAIYDRQLRIAMPRRKISNN